MTRDELFVRAAQTYEADGYHVVAAVSRVRD